MQGDSSLVASVARTLPDLTSGVSASSVGLHGLQLYHYSICCLSLRVLLLRQPPSGATTVLLTCLRHLATASLTVVSLPVKPASTISRHRCRALWLPFISCSSSHSYHGSRSPSFGGLVDISGKAFDCIHRRTVTRDSPVRRDISLIPQPFL